MNRIYQGRVSRVEVADDKDWKPFDPNPKLAKEKWQAALWQHHELFQDAVNYYTLALAAMAVDVEGDSAQAKALRGWASKIRETWQSASRKAQVFDGPQKRLVPALKLEGATGFDEATKQVLGTSRATSAQRAAALMQLLGQKGDLNQMCVDRLPWLASPPGKLDATSKALSSSQEVKRQGVVRQFHEWQDTDAIANAPPLDLGLFLTKPPTELVKGEQATQMLREYFEKAAEKHSSLNAVSAEFEKFINGRTDLEIPSPGRKPSGLYPIAAVFKLFPRQETLAAFRQATKSLAEGKDRDVVDDALADARVDDQPQFDYFTNLVFTTGKDERDTRAVWFEFDLAAFIEAIKAPRRYFEDTQRRESAAQRIRLRIAAMEGKGREASSADDEDESLPGFEDDLRIDLLKDIVQKKLAWLADAEEGTGAADSKEYAIRVRTVRGFGDIKRRWQALADTSKATEARLLEILADEQVKHRDDFGSATFYRELAKPENHPIWHDTGTQPWHADDPLAAWLDYKELQAELQDKERPIRFTPAHAKHSPRFFIFPKENEAKPKKPSKKPQKPGLKSRHESGQTQSGKLSFTAGVVLRTERGFAPMVVRIQYAAPRLCRDGIRSNGDSSLYGVPWLQPMMAALDFEKSPDPVNFANCRITLQPSNEKDFQLTFPVEVNTDKLIAGLGKETLWNRQFNLHPEGDSFYNASLRWLHEKQPAKPPKPWFDQVASFRTLATDLGQRDAGAFARMEASCGGDIGTKPSRFIGNTNGKQWHTVLERSGLFRLPGEDATVWREVSSCDKSNPKDSGLEFDFREELWGERGRPARDWEADDTAYLMRQLEVPPDDPDISLLPDNWRTELSFPEQNGKLLIALRRYQSRIARVHRWCWFLKGDAKQQETVWEEVAECDDVRLVSTEQKVAASKRDPRLGVELESQLQGRLHLAPTLLERIANRILPLRGRSWCWGKHADASEQNRLHELTQAGPSLDSVERPVWLRGQCGLSLERIEQVEELRKRCQSLNQTMRRPIGSKPPTRRDESVPDPCPDLLEKLDNLKKQRINQTAHLILAEALGLRLATPTVDKKTLREEKDQHGVYEKVLDKQGQWIGPVDFIVIEDLSRYRASQGRAPRENSRLMKWCHRAVRDKLKQLCEIFGLPVLETPAAYSSRFCSRSGVPGFRAQEVAAGFTKTGHWAWLAGKKDEQGSSTPEAQRLRALDTQLSSAQLELEADWIKKQRSGRCPKRTLLVPVSGGAIFVPIVGETNDEGLSPKVVQADINAAINLALRAIADPNVWTIHPRLRTQREGDALTTREKRKFGEKNPPRLTIAAGEKPITDTVSNPNFFADCAELRRIADRLVEGDKSSAWLTKEWTSATLSSDKVIPMPLLHSKTLWGTVKNAQWQRIEEINQKRLNDWFQKMDQTQIPY